jgi:hypothetical protein
MPASATTATVPASATTSAAMATSRRGDVRHKHRNGGCRQQGDHRFAQHHGLSLHPIAPGHNDAFGAIALQSLGQDLDAQRESSLNSPRPPFRLQPLQMHVSMRSIAFGIATGF